MVHVQALHQLVEVLAFHLDAEDGRHFFNLHQVKMAILIFIEAIELVLDDSIARSQRSRKGLNQLAELGKEFGVLIVFSHAPIVLENMDEYIIVWEVLIQLFVEVEEFILWNLLLLKVIQHVGQIVSTLIGDLRPLVAILGKLDAIFVPRSMEVLWSTLGRSGEVNDNAVVSVDPSGKNEACRLTFSTNTLTTRQTLLTVHLVEECDHAIAACVIWICVSSDVLAALVPFPRVISQLNLTSSDGATLVYVGEPPDLLEQGQTSCRDRIHQTIDKVVRVHRSREGLDVGTCRI